MTECYLLAKYTQVSIISFMYSSDDRSEVVFEIRLMPPLLSLSVLFYGFLMSGHVEIRWRGSPRIREREPDTTGRNRGAKARYFSVPEYY